MVGKALWVLKCLVLTADGVKESSVLKTVPLLLSHRISAAYPAPISKTFPDASGPLGWTNRATKGATYSGYNSY